MVSFRTTLLALASVVAVSADYYIDPKSVDMAIKRAWCNDQKSSCPTICLQTTTGKPTVNTCDAETLTYGCVCSDNKQPNISEYTLTLPYHVCTEWGTQCVTSCGSNNQCSSDCREKHPCGAQSPTRVNETTSTSATASATASPSSTNQVFDGLSDGNQNGNSNTKNAAGALRFGDSFGLVVVAGGLFAGFAVLL
ncbi:hypothetical protein C8A05DRAFT_14964 [Staphylotrichum tortipilum]|uniref:DUF7707 domain-containing protein n=1 Tax=Staphylotrichum tortipilum TaxID=2831512 RepID=A0AAN6RUJ4_9PEZI|nr:hypothetical protein C8A05DRAFT_14964 [Staphylotrichum longicolle]